MTINAEDLLRSVLESFDRIDYIKPDEIPDIDLYMDQVTTFMDTHLSASKRYPDDKILTKTMINNYTKAGLMPPPEKKKYSKEHMLMLIFIYYFKNILSISDLPEWGSISSGNSYKTSVISFPRSPQPMYTTTSASAHFAS